MARLRGATLAAALLLGFAAPVLAAGPQDGLIPVADYTTAKARDLAIAHQAELLKFSEHIYHCLPWLGVVKNGLGFPHPKGAEGDDRYLSVWVNIDQTEDPRFGVLPLSRRVSAMFSRYGMHLLKQMSQLSDISSDGDVRGFSVILSWLKPGTLDASQPIMETLALFVDKASLGDFLAQRIATPDFTKRATYNVFDGKTPLGRVTPLDIWEDNFNSTFKLKGYELGKGQHC
jgi:hypothetical protein